MNSDSKLGSVIREMRIHLGITQDELAKAARITRSTLSRLESHDCGSLKMATHIVETLGYRIGVHPVGVTPNDTAESIEDAAPVIVYRGDLLGGGHIEVRLQLPRATTEQAGGHPAS